MTGVLFLFSALLGILFLQSGVDKIVDRAGNLAWLTGHFKESPLASMVPLMVSIITVMEIAAGGISALGAAALVTTGTKTIGVVGALLSGATLVCLFFGQRMAKDYAGGETLAGYFTLVMVGTYLYLV